MTRIPGIEQVLRTMIARPTHGISVAPGWSNAKGFLPVRQHLTIALGNGTRKACLAMVFKLAESAQKRWRRLNKHELIQDVIAGVTFTDGEKKQAA